MTLIELLCFVALVGLVAGVLGGLMHWPLWVGLVPMALCLGFWLWLRRIGPSKSAHRKEKQESKP
jgi:hypothetical protein